MKIKMDKWRSILIKQLNLIDVFFDSEILAVMSSAYNSKMCQFPIEHFCSLFLINDPAYCRELCALHQIETSESGIKFVKANYVSTKVKYYLCNQMIFCVCEIFFKQQKNV